ncbi:MAG TPA: prepilin-type N-terminal cleavage/methylation domain-containing protein [Candidatus Aquilonibacter sp.]|nr:prepilin-type N-terminal cleavage/methylation domain-containing protein [Candidatus Aquilonibacter sp.]
MSSVEGRTSRAARTGEISSPRPSSLDARRAFTLIEILVAMALLSLIVIALMAVFNGTQTAFRAGLTQNDVLEAGRATMDLMTADLKELSPSQGGIGSIANANAGVVPVNFSVALPSGTGVYGNILPLLQPLIPNGQQVRTNVVENFFILSRGNDNGVPTWSGTGYAVCLSPTNLYSLYRFSSNCPVAAAGAPGNLFAEFQNYLQPGAGILSAPPGGSTNGWSHLLDGVVDLRVRAFDTNGVWINSQTLQGGQVSGNNIETLSTGSGSDFGETGFYMFGDMLPAAVEIEMGVLEDRTLQRAESLGIPNQLPWTSPAQWSFLTNSAGQVHLFRERVTIPAADPAAYQ